VYAPCIGREVSSCRFGVHHVFLKVSRPWLETDQKSSSIRNLESLLSNVDEVEIIYYILWIKSGLILHLNH
jgi:hypothetical protein